MPEQASLSLNPADIQNLTNAVRFASKNGAFEMEHITQLFPSVNRLEEWVVAIQAAQDEAAQPEEVAIPTASKKGKNK